MSGFDDYQYASQAYATTTGTDCFRNPKGEQVYTGASGKKGYSPVSCAAAKDAFYKVHGSADFLDLQKGLQSKQFNLLAANLENAKARDPGENPASNCQNCNQDWTTNPLGTINCELGKISCEGTTGLGNIGEGMMMPMMLMVVAVVVVVIIAR